MQSRDMQSRADGFRGKTLFVEPHPDDAVYSAGGLIANMRKGGKPFFCLCLFSACGSDDPVRHKESLEAFEKKLESTILFGQLEDHHLIKHDQGFRVYLQRYVKAKSIIENVLLEHRPARVYGPLTAGMHPDHVMTNEILIELWKKHSFDLWFYEDFPYMNNSKYEYIKPLSHVKKKVRLEASYEDITDSLEAKVDLHMIYRSQHDHSREELYQLLKNLGEAIQLEGEDAHTRPGRLYERFWKCVP